MKDNRGFSLIELMGVLCITALLITGSAISIRTIKYADSEYCAKEIDSALNTLRMEAMSRGDQHLYLVIEWNSTDKEYYMSYAAADKNVELDNTNWQTAALSNKNRKKLASNEITLSCSTDVNGNAFTDIRDTQQVILISFEPENGAFKSSYRRIRLTSNSKICIIYMVGQTGNHYIRS